MCLFVGKCRQLSEILISIIFVIIARVYLFLAIKFVMEVDLFSICYSLLFDLILAAFNIV